MGEYDLVEEVLAGIGAEFFFTGVRMQPGKPVVFGRLPAAGWGLRSWYFFGLPGNPVSTQVTFHCFVEPMLRAMGGAGVRGPRFVQATLGEDVAGKAGLMRMLAGAADDGRVRPEVRLVGWQGSGDLAANARANCYAVLPPERERFEAGDVITCSAAWVGYWVMGIKDDEIYSAELIRDDSPAPLGEVFPEFVMEMEKPSDRLSHYDEAGQAHMVDVSGKAATRREAVAAAFVELRRRCWRRCRRILRGIRWRWRGLRGFRRRRRRRI